MGDAFALIAVRIQDPTCQGSGKGKGMRALLSESKRRTFFFLRMSIGTGWLFRPRDWSWSLEELVFRAVGPLSGVRHLVVEKSRLLSKVRKAALGLIALALLALFLMPAPLYGDHPGATITGRVVNGTSGAEPPANLDIVLHVIGSGEEVNFYTAVTDSDGGFRFEDVRVHNDSTYAVTAAYGDVLYSSTLDPSALAEPVELVLHETTSNLGDLRVEANVLLIGGPSPDKNSLSAFEVVRLVNEGDRTFVPNLAQPGSMSFLRFPLPRRATELEVSSDLHGGRIITVDTGFALTAPVTPGAHRVTYSFRIPYEGSEVELIHSFPMGADAFRLLLEDEMGELRDPGILTPQASADVERRSYDVWSASQLAPGTRLALNIVDLPEPPLLRRLGDSLANGPYLKIGIPAALGTVLAGLLLYALGFRRLGRATSGNTSLGAAAAVLPTNASRGPQDPTKDEGRSLMEEIARIDDLFQGGKMAEEAYQKRREELKARLLRTALTSQES